MITCTKRYIDIPFAHRQPNHLGHCALIHGHDWSFEFEFAANKLDECGFVVDFGRLKPLKADLDRFDHALLLNSDDPFLGQLKGWLVDLQPKLANIVEVPDCSAEGLAKLMLERADIIVSEMTNGRVKCVRCTCFEDSKNSATAANIFVTKAFV